MLVSPSSNCTANKTHILNFKSDNDVTIIPFDSKISKEDNQTNNVPLLKSKMSDQHAVFEQYDINDLLPTIN